MSKNLMSEIEQLQKENERLKEYQKAIDKILKIEFGRSRNEILDLVKKSDSSSATMSDFEKKIRQYFGLKTGNDMADFLRIMCNENNKNFFAKKRTENAEKQPPASGDRKPDLRQ